MNPSLEASPLLTSAEAAVPGMDPAAVERWARRQMRGGRGQDARGLLGGGGGRFFVDGVRIVLQRFPSHAAAVDALRLHLLGHQLHVRAQHLIVRAARRRVAIRYPLRARNRRLVLAGGWGQLGRRECDEPYGRELG